MNNVGESRIITFNKSSQTFTALKTGTYKLEVWGAQGGNRGNVAGGKGGYSKGTISLKKGDVLQINVGGFGDSIGTGWNGGGRVGSTNVYGGGATDMRVSPFGLSNRVIVAGGGGSVGSASKPGGYGGGTTGESRTESYGSGGNGGTQTAGGGNGGALGVGGNGSTANSGYGGAGGGGYYGGGGVTPDSSGDDDRGGGGGSGYVNTSILTDTQLISGNASMPDSATGTQTGQSNNGIAKITAMTIDSSIEVFVNVNGSWEPVTRQFVKVNDTWEG